MIVITIIVGSIVIIALSLISLVTIAIVHVQRHGVVIETCMMGTGDSAFLQQAAHITEGLYLRPIRTGALLQYLLVSICLIESIPSGGVHTSLAHQTCK